MRTIWDDDGFEKGCIEQRRDEQAATALQIARDMDARADVRNRLRAQAAALSGWDVAASIAFGAMGVIPFGELPERAFRALSPLMHDDLARDLAGSSNLPEAAKTLLTHGGQEALSDAMDRGPSVMEGSSDGALRVVAVVPRAAQRVSAGECPFDLHQLADYFDLDMADVFGVAAVRFSTDLYARFRKIERNTRAYHEIKALSYGVTGALSLAAGNPNPVAAALAAWHFGSALWVSRALTKEIVALCERAQLDGARVLSDYRAQVQASAWTDQLTARVLAATSDAEHDDSYVTLNAFSSLPLRRFS